MKPVLCPIFAGAFLIIATRTQAEVRPPERFAGVREFVQNAIAEERIPSAALAVIQNNSLVWAEGFGLADLEERRPATADSIYLLASVSKPMTATGLMVLVDRGQVELDRPANDYLPGPKLRALQGSARDITVRRLANHTSGMQVHYNFYYDGIAPLSHDEVIRRYGISHMLPGERVEYCNLAFGVLDYITESVSGVPWRQFMEENVYDPLAMKHTSDRVRPGLETHATRQYQSDLAGRFLRVPAYRFDHDGASAIWSSANDLSRFLRMHLNGGTLEGKRVLNNDTVHGMQRVTGPRDRTKPADGFGIAWHMQSYLGHRCFEHSGGMPGVSTWVRGFPDDQAGFVVLINASAGNVIREICQRTTKALFPDANESTEPQTTAVVDERSDRFTGKWFGEISHFESDIPLVFVIKSGTVKATFGKAQPVDLRDVSFRNGVLRGQTRGFLQTQPGYHGPVTLEFSLTIDENRLSGIAVAKADGYFAVSHGVSLRKEADSSPAATAAGQ